MTQDMRSFLTAFSFLFFSMSAARGDADVVATLKVPPSRTQPARMSYAESISAYGYGDHYVVRPFAAAQKLFVFLGGSISVPSYYQNIVEQAAYAGFDSIGLSYPNNAIIQVQCSDDDCFENLRGEIAFGRDVSYAPGEKSYRASQGLDGAVQLGNSIINRLVSLLDYLAQNDSPGWQQYLIEDRRSPYQRPSDNEPVYPDWSRIVLAGHSQGGGEAAFIAMNLPEPVSRVVLLSSPQDNLGGWKNARPPAWMMKPSTTPMNRWYGLRHAEGILPTSDSDEGVYGDHVNANWQMIGLRGLPGDLSGKDLPTTAIFDTGEVFDADEAPHRLFIGDPLGLTPLISHDSTAKDGAFSDQVLPVWRYLFGDSRLSFEHSRSNRAANLGHYADEHVRGPH